LGIWLLAVCAAHAQTIAITDATVHTVGPAGTIEGATVLVEGDRIVAVGADVAVPAGAQVVDGSGKIVTPGLFSPVGALGLSEVGAVTGTNDAIQQGVQFAAGFDVAHGFNPRSLVVAISRMDGVTHAGITPQSGGASSQVLSGLGSVVDLGGAADAFLTRGAVVVANLGVRGSALAGDSRAAAVQVLRAALRDALDYRDNKTAHERGERRAYSVSQTDLDTLLRVLDGSVALMFNVNRASDIEGVLELAGDFSIRAIVLGGAEAWMVADRLAAAQVPVIVDGINNLPTNFDRLNARLDSASLLVAAGVRVAFGAAAQTHDARLIAQSAGNAVANGLSWHQALQAITLAPAAVWGIDDQVGSIEAGKLANLVIWDDDPLEITSYPEQTYIRGVPVPMHSRQTLLRDRYLQIDSALPPAYRAPANPDPVPRFR